MSPVTKPNKNPAHLTPKNHVKRRPTLIAMMLLATTWGMAIEPQPAYGCSCVQPDAATVERDRAAAVFSGAVTHITESNQGYIVDFAVSEYWKTTEPEAEATTVQINTANNSAACGYNFEVGQHYLVYAHSNPNDTAAGLGVNICSRTAPLDNAAEDITEFGGTPTDPVGERTPGCQSID